jgi:hypothetical protein
MFNRATAYLEMGERARPLVLVQAVTTIQVVYNLNMR